MHNLLDFVAGTGRKFKERLRGKKGKRDKTGADTAEESIDSSGSLLRPVPHIAASGHDGEGSRANTDTQQVHHRDRSPQPESVSVGGRDGDRGGKEADVDKKVASQGHSSLEPNIETVVGGGPNPTEVGQLIPSPSTPILHGRKSESTWTRLFHLLHLIVPSDDTEPSAGPDQVPGVVSSNKSAGQGPAAGKEKSNLRSTAVAVAKALLRGVNESADVFGPLKSVTAGLCFILDNYEVRPLSPIYRLQRLRISQRMKANTQAIESLAPRVKTLNELLRRPVPDGDVDEAARREKLEQ